MSIGDGGEGTTRYIHARIELSFQTDCRALVLRMAAKPLEKAGKSIRVQQRTVILQYHGYQTGG